MEVKFSIYFIWPFRCQQVSCYCFVEPTKAINPLPLHFRRIPAAAGSHSFVENENEIDESVKIVKLHFWLEVSRRIGANMNLSKKANFYI